MASKPINICWIRTGSEPYWKIMYSIIFLRIFRFGLKVKYENGSTKVEWILSRYCLLSCKNQGGRGHWAVIYNSSQNFLIICWLNNFIEFLLVGLSSSVFKRFNDYKKGKLKIKLHWDSTSIFRPLSYLFHSLCKSTTNIIYILMSYSMTYLKKLYGIFPWVNKFIWIMMNYFFC